MKFTLDRSASHTISHWIDGEIKIHGNSITRHVIVSPTELVTNWEPAGKPDELRIEDLQPALALAPEVLIVGTGSASILPPAKLAAALAVEGVGAEFMDTRAACRTFNVLSGEGREVVAALFIGAVDG